MRNFPQKVNAFLVISIVSVFVREYTLGAYLETFL